MSIKINKSWLSEQTDEVQSVIGMLLEHIKKQDERIAQLEKRNAELEKRLGITPQNSSLPPSTQQSQAEPQPGLLLSSYQIPQNGLNA